MHKVKYLTWHQFRNLKAAELEKLLGSSEIGVTVEGDCVFSFGSQNVHKVAKEEVEATVGRNGSLQNVHKVGEKSSEATLGENSPVQNVHKADLTKIPGVYRGMPPGGLPPEPEIIRGVVRYERGQRYAPRTQVAVYNRVTKQTEIREAPEMDAEGNEIW